MIENYKQLLEYPEWKAKRIEVLKQDKFTCQICFKTDVKLNVYHKIYYPEHLPWDYNSRDMITLCENCHKIYHKHLALTKAFIKLTS